MDLKAEYSALSRTRSRKNVKKNKCQSLFDSVQVKIHEVSPEGIRVTRVSNPGFTETENPGYLGFFQTRKPGFWMPVNPGFSGLNYDLHCVIKRPH